MKNFYFDPFESKISRKMCKIRSYFINDSKWWLLQLAFVMYKFFTLWTTWQKIWQFSSLKKPTSPYYSILYFKRDSKKRNVIRKLVFCEESWPLRNFDRIHPDESVRAILTQTVGSIPVKRIGKHAVRMFKNAKQTN